MVREMPVPPPGRQIELVGAVVAVAGVDVVAIGRLAHPQLIPVIRGRVGRSRPGEGDDRRGGDRRDDGPEGQRTPH